MYNVDDIIAEIRNKTDRVSDCKKETDILVKVMMCKAYLKQTEYGKLLESYLIERLGATKITHDGDCEINGKNIEIKVSLGTKKGSFSFVQIRPDNKVDYYLLFCYDANVDAYGKIYVLFIPSNDLYSLLPEYGSYAHGTIEKNNAITADNIYNKGYEYRIEPNSNMKRGKYRRLWDILVEKYLVDLDDIVAICQS
jgi:hypothetical protein